jgi:hypothetical protein
MEYLRRGHVISEDGRWAKRRRLAIREGDEQVAAGG